MEGLEEGMRDEGIREGGREMEGNQGELRL